VLPEQVSVELDWGSWRVPPIFGFLQTVGNVDDEEMWRVFNMGLGLIFVTAPEVRPEGALPIGRVVDRRDQRVIVSR
jgi:phosphoribosylformylglycinamidine cyclo-ligase